MSVQLGKRKRRKELIDTGDASKDQDATDLRLQKLLQSHFEAKYEPLEIDAATTLEENKASGSESDSDSSEDEWAGISDVESPKTVEIVTYEGKDETDRWREKLERRSFMTNKPPAPGKNLDSRKKRSKDDLETDDANDAANIKNDLALQRLLQESSLLRNARTDAHGTMPSAVHPSDDPVTASLALRGTDRHKALDMRLQSLGAKDSLFKQKKMPLNHRLGIVEKQRTWERARRLEARENGIILETATKQAKDRPRATVKRVRGVGGPSVGRMKGGTLVLSKKDVRRIQGSDGGNSARDKGRKRR